MADPQQAKAPRTLRTRPAARREFAGAPDNVALEARLETQKLSFEDFKNIVVERLGCEPEQVTMDASFQEDLNADSLDLVELIYAFEENTGLEIPDEDAEKITTVGQAWEYIQEKAGS